jgi:hypothetical protein
LAEAHSLSRTRFSLASRISLWWIGVDLTWKFSDVMCKTIWNVKSAWWRAEGAKEQDEKLQQFLEMQKQRGQAVSWAPMAQNGESCIW